MKLRVKALKLGAGRPVAFLHESDAESLNVHVGDRVALAYNSKKIIAIVDIAKGLFNRGEIAVSDDIINEFGLKTGDIIDVGLTLKPKSIKSIMKKLNKGILTKKEINEIIKDIVSNALTEAEIAYFVSACYENSMTMKETIALTEAIFKTGNKLNWHTRKIADKHSIGGVAGNRTTPIIVSICSAAGIVMPKTSSRAITTAAGTADVIEAIAKVDFSAAELKRIVRKTNACLAWGGSLGLAPADDKIIQVERMINLDPEPQLLASIIAKKLSVGSRYVLIDIPYGRGAKVSKSRALKLKNKFLNTARHFKLEMKVILTRGEQPIGNGIGPMLEIRDILKVLKREKNAPKDLEEKSVMLSGELIEMMGKAEKGKGKELARQILDSGMAFKKFREIIKAQKGSLNNLKEAKLKHNIYAERAGKIAEIHNKRINNLGRLLGCPADKAAGIYIYKHQEERVKKGEKILTLYSESKQKLNEAVEFYKNAKPVIIR